MAANDYDYKNKPSPENPDPYDQDLGLDNEIRQIIKDLDQVSSMELGLPPTYPDNLPSQPPLPQKPDYPSQAPSPARPDQGLGQGPGPGPGDWPPEPNYDAPQDLIEANNPPYQAYQGPNLAPDTYRIPGATPPPVYPLGQPREALEPFLAQPNNPEASWPSQAFPGPAQGPPPSEPWSPPLRPPAPNPAPPLAPPLALAMSPRPPAPSPQGAYAQTGVLTAKNPVPVPRPPAPPDNTLVLTDKLDFNHDKANDIIDLIDEVDEEAPANYLSDQTRVSELTARELAQLIEAAVARALIKAGKN